MADRAGSSGAGWRGRNPGRSAKKTTGSINRAIGGLLFLIVVLIGGILALVFWPTRQTPRSISGYWVAKYDNPRLATDPTAESDLAALKSDDVYGDGKGLLVGSWPQVADHLKSRAQNEFALIYVSGRACLSDTGDVLVVPGDADPGNRNGWLALSDVLEAVKGCKAKQKLLVLDVMRPTADPSLGIVTNDVAGRVKEQVDSATDPGRLVLTACSPGQTSSNSEFLGRSIFNYYVQEGLRGWADKDEDGSIGARELSEFVAGRVSDWADRVRGTRQTPALLGPADLDFRVASVPASGKKPKLADDPKIKALLDPGAAAKTETASKEKEAKKDEPAAPPASNYPKPLRDGWTLVRDWRSAGADRLAPRPISRLQASLLKAERDWRFGRNEEAVLAEYRKSEDLEKTRHQLAMTANRPDELPSVALETAIYGPPKEAVVKATADLFAARSQMNKPDLAEKDLEPIVKEFLDKTKIDSHAELSAAVLAALDGPPPRQRNMYLDMMRFADQTLRAHRSRLNLAPEARHVETLFLQSLIASSSPPSKPIPDEDLLKAITSIRRGERLSAASDAFPWLSGLIDEAAVDRRAAQVLLKNHGYVSSAEWKKAWNRSTGLDADLDEVESSLVDALATYKLAAASLPSLLPYLEASQHASAIASWKEAAERTRPLADSLLPPTDKDARARWTVEFAKSQAENWRLGNAELKSSLAALSANFRPETMKSMIVATKGTAASPKAYRDIDDLLQAPVIDVEDRDALAAAAKRLDAALHKQHFDVTTFAPPAAPPASAGADEMKRARERADRSRLVLEIGRVDTKPLQETIAAFANKPDAAARQAVAKALGSLWKALPDNIAAQSDLYLVDRMGRVAPPRQNIPTLDNLETPPPTTRLRAENEALMWAWASDFYRYLARDYDATPFIKSVAQTLQAMSPRTAPPRPSVSIEKDRGSPRAIDQQPLTRQKPEGYIDLVVTLDAVGGTSPKTTIDVLPPVDARLIANLEAAPPPTAQKPTKYAIKVRSAVDVEGQGQSAAPIEGLLVRLTVDDRPFHLPVRIDAKAAINAPSLIVTRNAASPDGAVGELLFRSIKDPQAYHVWVKNPGDQPRKLKVVLLAKGAEDPAASAELTVPGNQTVKVDNFILPPPQPTAPPTTPAAPTGVEVRNGIVVRLIDPDRPSRDPASLLQEFAATPSLIPADKLVAVVEAKFRPTNPENGKVNRLSVKVRAINRLEDGPCEVSLIPDPSLIPGLRPGFSLEQRTAKLSNFDDEKELFVEGLKFDEANASDVAGAFLIAVDGDTRALKYKVNFVRANVLAQNASVDERTDVRVLDPKSPAEADKPYEVIVAVENPPEGGKLSAGFGRDDNGRFVYAAEPSVDLARRWSVRMTPQPKGVLSFKASVADQVFVLDPKGLLGPVQLQVALNSGVGRRERTVLVDVEFDQKPTDVSVAPIGVENGVLKARARGRTRAGFASVKFFLGKPANEAVPDEKTAVVGVPDPAAPGSYVAELPLPKDARRVDVGVEFINKVGLKSFGGASYEIPAEAMAAANPAAAPKLGIVEGRVTEGEIPQGAITVSIYQKDSKPDQIKTGVTDGKGRYRVTDIPPGVYMIYAIREGVNRKALDTVIVEAGKTTVKNLGLSE